jgi:hypothetical protein
MPLPNPSPGWEGLVKHENYGFQHQLKFNTKVLLYT